MIEIVVIAHNIRSTYNIGALLRSSEGIGVKKLYFSGYTPYPKIKDDSRLPHISERMTKQIHKTALGAENSQQWEYQEDIDTILNMLSMEGFLVVALEQTDHSIPIPEFKSPNKVAVLIGEEVGGIDHRLLKSIETHIEIPMFGEKESFNVVEATSMCLYHLRFAN